jgi:alcohol dehydrogenase (cytochrome c)
MPGTRLAAFDAATGKMLWNVKIGDISVAEFVSSAPIAWNGLVFVGLAGSDWGIRGRMMAYDAATGKEKWRFYTIPMGSERGAETWHIPETAKRGGGGMWTTYTLDTKTGELFVPVANPSPDFDKDVRPGDNLFTNSVIALDAKTGALKWWYQATPRDAFDYDMGAAPMLYTGSDGKARLAAGSKDGFVHVLNRDDHKLAFKVPITTIKYADKPTPEGVHACPGPLGGVEWNGPAFDPRNNTMFVGSVDWCATFFSGEYKYVAGDLYMGTKNEGDPAEEARGWVTAIDGNTGNVRWKFNTPASVVAGVTPTAGGLVFTGDLAGNFYALSESTGKPLAVIRTGGAIAGGVVTYLVDGKQYVATTTGNISRSTFKTAGSPRIMILAVDAPQGMMIALPDITTLGMPAGSAGGAPGAQQYSQYCAGCHGTTGEGGGNGPNLVTSARKDVNAIAAFIKNPNPPMPKLYPSPLDEAGVAAVAEYVRSLQSGAGGATPSSR